MAIDLRERAAEADRLLATRLDEVVPMVMRRAGVAAWVLVAREYNEDPVVSTMLPSTWMAARRRTILVFLDTGETVRRLAVSRYGVADLFEGAWSPDTQPDQWSALAGILDEADPGTIAVNRSSTFALADGLTGSEYEALLAALPSHLRSRLRSVDELTIGWLETRTADDMAHYPSIVRTSHEILRRALSSEVIEPTVTTTEEVVWWLRHEVESRRLRSWFQPTVSVQREGSGETSFAARPGDQVIERGDLVHIDFGLVDLGLHTDMQQHAYVRRSGELDAPAGLQAGISAANHVQDLVMAEFALGRAGNEVLAAALATARAAGMEATIYTHPIGLHGHAAGPTIGLWDQQDGVAGAGEYPIHADTAYSIELMVERPVPEWSGQTIRFMLEEDAFFDGRSVKFMDGRQTRLWII
ncbi:MAG: M24 family metallopeptidase [Acidimicrobiia bacterium]|nr:M24 family metallopeptidase [Acidimicrobiia bacterium]